MIVTRKSAEAARYRSPTVRLWVVSGSRHGCNRADVGVGKPRSGQFGMSDAKVDINSWLEDELYQRYLHDRRAVDESLREAVQDAIDVCPVQAITLAD